MPYTEWKQEERKRHRKTYILFLWLQEVLWLYVVANNSLNDSK